MRISRLLAGVACLFAAAPVTAQSKALRFAAVIDGTGRVVQRGVVIVNDNRIVRVARPDEPLPAGAVVVDLSRYTAIPGLIDVHTHMTYFWDSTSGTNPWRQPQRTPAQTVQLAQPVI